MKLLILLSFLLIFSCKKDETSSPINPPPVDTIKTDTIHKGSVLFYLQEYPFANYGDGVEIRINGIVKDTITSVPSFIPSCGSSFGYTYTDTIGSYFFMGRVLGGNGRHFSDSIYVTDGGCYPVVLNNQ